jgi:hypothetical protein
MQRVWLLPATAMGEKYKHYHVDKLRDCEENVKYVPMPAQHIQVASVEYLILASAAALWMNQRQGVFARSIQHPALLVTRETFAGDQQSRHFELIATIADQE